MKSRPKSTELAIATTAALMIAGAALSPSAAVAQIQAAPSLGGPGLVEGVVVKVNDDIISSYDLRQRIIWILLTTGIQATDENLAQLQAEARETLINERLQAQEIRRQEDLRGLPRGTLFAAEQDVDAAIANLAQQNEMTVPQFMQLLASRGISERSVREQIRVTLSWRNWTSGYYGRRIRITDDRVNAVIRDLEAAASSPSYLISEIFVSADRAGGMQNALTTANQIIAQLQQQARFEGLARQFSSLPTAASGGDAGWMRAGLLPTEVEAVLSQMRPGQITRPIETSDGVYVVLLRDRRSGEASTRVSLKQIALPLPASADQAAAQEAQGRLLAVKDQITGCDNIDEVAQTAGLSSADLGQAETKDLAAAFRTAVETLDENEVSEPIRTEVGLHMIALCDRSTSTADMPSRDEIELQLYAREIAMVQRRELRNLRNSATIMRPQ